VNAEETGLTFLNKQKHMLYVQINIFMKSTYWEMFMKIYLLGDVSVMQYLFAVFLYSDDIRMFESCPVISHRISADGVCIRMSI